LRGGTSTRKPDPTRPELQQPPKRLSACPRRVHIRGVPVKEHPRRTVLSEIASGATRQTDPSQLTVPSSVAGSRRTVALWASLLSTSILQGSPGRRQVAEIPVRWFI